MRVELCKGNTSKIAKANPVTSDEVATKFVKKTPALDSSITCVLPSTSSQPAAGSSRKASPTSSSPTGQPLLFLYFFIISNMLHLFPVNLSAIFFLSILPHNFLEKNLHDLCDYYYYYR